MLKHRYLGKCDSRSDPRVVIWALHLATKDESALSRELGWDLVVTTCMGGLWWQWALYVYDTMIQGTFCVVSFFLCFDQPNGAHVLVDMDLSAGLTCSKFLKINSANTGHSEHVCPSGGTFLGGLISLHQPAATFGPLQGRPKERASRAP